MSCPNNILFSMAAMNDLIHEGDYLSLLFLIFLLAFIGSKMIHSYPSLHYWGLRFAAATFILFTLSAIANSHPQTASSLIGCVFVGLLAAGLLLGPVWIALSGIGFLWSYLRKARDAAASAATSRKRRREEERQARRRQREQAEWERSAPQREREARLAQRQLELESSRRAAENQRREEARAACELLYNLREHDIASRFSREQLQQFIDKYMDDSKSVDIVERRAKELQRLIHEHHEVVKPTVKFKNLAELTAWYAEQKQQIEDLRISDLYKADQLVRLNERYSELMERVMEVMQR